MTDGELQERARRAGLSVNWTDAHGQHRSVSPDTLRAVLEVLGDQEAAPDGPATMERCYTIADAAPGRKLSAVAVQLYSLRGNGAFGDMRALNDFVRSAARTGGSGWSSRTTPSGPT